MKNKLILTLALLLALALASITVNAYAVACNSPVNVSVVQNVASGATGVNIIAQITNNGTINLTMHYPNGTNIQVNTTSNLTFYSSLVNFGTVNSESVKIILNATGGNSTTNGANNNNYTATECTYISDLANPTATITSSLKTIRRGGSIPFYCESSDALDTALTYLFRLYKPVGTSVDFTSNNDTFSKIREEMAGSNTGLSGKYYVNCRVQDNAGNQDWGENLTFTTSSDDTADIVIAKDQADEIRKDDGDEGFSTTTIVVFLMIAFIMIVGGYFLIKKK